MNVIFLSFVIFALAFTGMAVGVIARRRGIRPCNGVPSASDGEAQSACEGCGGSLRACELSSAEDTETATDPR